MTPVSYLNYIRLSKAEHLMEVTSDTLENIALQCGFFNYSHFTGYSCAETAFA